MIHLGLHRLRVNDPPPMKDKPITRLGSNIDLYVIEHGMASGKSAVALVIHHESGDFYIETTAVLFKHAAKAVDVWTEGE